MKVFAKLRTVRLANRLVRRPQLSQFRWQSFERETPMLCMQCEQTSHGTGCTSVGICGKLPETADLQDLVLAATNQLCEAIAKAGPDVPASIRAEAEDHVLEATFSTLTNVNFDEARMIEYIGVTCGLHEKLRAAHPPTDPLPASLAPVIQTDNEADLLQISVNHGLESRRQQMGDDDTFGLREMAQYGMKGTMAYMAHAETIRKDFGAIYSEEERKHIFDEIFEYCGALTNTGGDVASWLGLNLQIGALNVQVLEVLDRSHRTAFGSPRPQEVSSRPVPGKCICVSGHDVTDVLRVLNATKGTGINVYTHGELLPAHGYPKLNEHEHLKGHFGTAWQNQYREFRDFPGPILMTSNCIMPPRRRYRERIFTTNAVGYSDIKHVNIGTSEGIAELIETAQMMDGFSSEDCERIGAKSDNRVFTTGFGHEAILSHADTILSAIKSGNLEHVFVIGGCDGTEKSRSYFTELTKATPEKSVVLTAGCGKYRVFEAGLGELGNTGIPRVLDMGQCNDSYSGVVIALKLAEALEVDVHELPLHFAISWFEQKAVACLLSLLHLGFKNIRIGPALPAFVTPHVLTYLNENLGLTGCNLKDEQADMELMISGK